MGPIPNRAAHEQASTGTVVSRSPPPFPAESPTLGRPICLSLPCSEGLSPAQRHSRCAAQQAERLGLVGACQFVVSSAFFPSPLQPQVRLPSPAVQSMSCRCCVFLTSVEPSNRVRFHVAMWSNGGVCINVGKSPCLVPSSLYNCGYCKSQVGWV